VSFKCENDNEYLWFFVIFARFEGVIKDELSEGGIEIGLENDMNALWWYYDASNSDAQRDKISSTVGKLHADRDEHLLCPYKSYFQIFALLNSIFWFER
jgi:hypothetical protein